MSKNLGNDVPPILQHVEGLVFDALLSMVRGERTSLGALKDIVSAIQWDAIKTVDVDVTKYYLACMTLPLCDCATTDHILISIMQSPQGQHPTASHKRFRTHVEADTIVG